MYLIAFDRRIQYDIFGFLGLKETENLIFKVKKGPRRSTYYPQECLKVKNRGQKPQRSSYATGCFIELQLFMTMMINWLVFHEIKNKVEGV